MDELLSFDDVLIAPQFSLIKSRKDVDTTVKILGLSRTIPIISSNMDTITGERMAIAMADEGALGCLPRFADIEQNVLQYKNIERDNIPYSPKRPCMVSIGLGKKELERAEALIDAGAQMIVIDVAHGAQMSVVEQYNALREKYDSNIGILVGNFATAQSIKDFEYYSPYRLQAIKVGIGNGAACTTRIKTGVGIPQLHAIMDCAQTGVRVIADGGCKNAGDIAKAVAAGADAVFVGRMLAGTDETPGEIITEGGDEWLPDSRTIISYPVQKFKKYRGSASAESYKDQGKNSEWRTAEGESYLVPYVGSVYNILKDINGGLRSSMTYVGANNIKEFREKTVFVRCSTLSNKENHAHGKN